MECSRDAVVLLNFDGVWEFIAFLYRTIFIALCKEFQVLLYESLDKTCAGLRSGFDNDI